MSENTPPIENLPFELDRSSLNRHEGLQRDSSALKGRLDGLISREQQLITDVSQAKGRVALKPEIESVLDELQKRAHDRSVGAFERMLTGITDDVLPDYKGQRSVRLDLTTERNMPALDIFIDHMGNREEITSGAVANVVSTGLRFIALARSGARRFLVLDEADCWIDGVAVQNYFNVVNQLSRDAGIQTVVITHHDLSAFSEEFRIYRITDVQSQDAVAARNMDLVSPGRMETTDLNKDHISFIGVKNVEGYPNAAIELSPGVTVIQGANQRGKSSWARMLRAALMADCGDSIVRHGHTSSEIAIGFSDGRILEYQRNRKGLPKAEYALHSPESWEERLSGTTLKEMRDGEVRALHHTLGAKLPEWLPGETGVYEIDGINIQLWGQFTPVFMLDRPASARASLLSIGRESGHLYAMSDTYKDDVKADNLLIREGEKEVAVIRAVSKSLTPLPELIARVDDLKIQALDINEESKALKDIAQITDQLRDLQVRVSLMNRQVAAGQLLVDTPAVEPTDRLSSWLESHANAKRDAAVQIHAVLPEIPLIEETMLAQRVIETSAHAHAMALTLQSIPHIPPLPEVSSTTEIQSILGGLSQSRMDASLILRSNVPDVPEVSPTSEIQALLQSLKQAGKDASADLKETIPQTPVVEDTSEISVLLQSLKTASQVALSQERQFKDLQVEMARIEAELQEASQTLGNECPVCHSIMTVDMLLGQGAQGHDHAHIHAPSGVENMDEATVKIDKVVEVSQAVESQEISRATMAAAVVAQASQEDAKPAVARRMVFRR